MFYFPSLFKSTTVMSLKYDMDKFRYNRELYDYGHLPDDHILKHFEKELNELFDKEMEPSNITMTAIPTMESRLEEYLGKIVDNSMYAKIVTRPTYCNYTATYSVEQYMTKSFLNPL